MKSRTRWFPAFTLILSCFLGTAGCGDDSEGSSPAGIGLLFPLSGEAAFVADARNGA